MNNNYVVIKRNGEIAPYESIKIKNAIEKANQTVKDGEKISSSGIEEIISMVEDRFALLAEDNYGRGELKVEEIQDLVEEGLFKLAGKNLYDRYHNYRQTRMMVRNIAEKSGVSSSVEQSILNLTGRKKAGIGEVADVDIEHSTSYIKEENSNKNANTASTQRDLIAGEISRDLTKRILLSRDVSEAHDDGKIHFHDADYFLQPIFNCCLINIGDMLDNGTVMNGYKIESPKSFRVACTVLSQIIACVASNQYGGQSVDMIHLGKYVRKSAEKIRRKRMADGLTGEELEKVVNSEVKDEIKDGVQTIQYQINTLMTTNGQSPFVTLFLHLEKDDEFIKENAQIIEEILKQRYEGVKNEAGVAVTPAFPKLVYVLDEFNNLSGGEYDYLTELAVKCTAKRMYPDYISAKKMKENYEGNIFSPMGCRSFLAPWKDADGNYKFEGRFNQGVVSLNLPRIAIEATTRIRDAEDNGIEVSEDMREEAMLKFWTILDERLALCYKALMERHNALLGTTSDTSPIHWQHGAIARLQSGEKIDKFLKGGYSSISLGYIGVYETAKLMTGESNTSKIGHDFSIQLLEYLRDTCKRWKKTTGIGFALYGTPAESLCYRFARIDAKKYGEIKDITDKGYYTNSFHVDVRENINAFDKLTFESEFQNISSGGCISYVEMPNLEKNLDVIKEIVKFIYDNIQYAEFNSKSDYCMACGYSGEIIINDNNEWECPCCGNKDHSKMSVVRRTCGYLGSNFWNVGKTKEIKARVMHIGEPDYLAEN